MEHKNISGYSPFNNNTTLLSSLNVSGRTFIGGGVYNYSDPLFEAKKTSTIRKNITLGSRVDWRDGTGYGASSLSMEEGYDINKSTLVNATSTSVINLNSNKAINFNAPKANLSNDLFILGSVTSLHIGVKSPMNFTTDITVSISVTNYPVYDIELTKYTKSVLLNGYNISQFRARHWQADGDFEYSSVYIYELNLKRYEKFMLDRSGLSIFLISSPCENYYLRE